MNMACRIRGRQSGISKPVVVLVSLLAITMTLLLTIQLRSSPAKAITLPTPNAYDTLHEAGELVTDMPEDYAKTTDVTSLKAFVNAHKESIQLAEAAMTQNGVVPINYSSGVSNQLESISSIRQTMRLLYCKGRSEELEEEYGKAANTYSRLYALGNKTSQGGLMIHKLASIAYERQGLSQLEKIVGKLTQDQKAEVARLISINRQPVDPEKIVQREHIMVKREHGNLVGAWMILVTSGGHMETAVGHIKTADAQVDSLMKRVLELLAE